VWQVSQVVRYIQRDVVRIDTLGVISLVAGGAGIGCIVVIALVTIILTGGGQVGRLR
jgi:hypothetical protein